MFCDNHTFDALNSITQRNVYQLVSGGNLVFIHIKIYIIFSAMFAILNSKLFCVNKIA